MEGNRPPVRRSGLGLCGNSLFVAGSSAGSACTPSNRLQQAQGCNPSVIDPKPGAQTARVARKHKEEPVHGSTSVFWPLVMPKQHEKEPIHGSTSVFWPSAMGSPWQPLPWSSIVMLAVDAAPSTGRSSQRLSFWGSLSPGGGQHSDSTTPMPGLPRVPQTCMEMLRWSLALESRVPNRALEIKNQSDYSSP